MFQNFWSVRKSGFPTCSSLKATSKLLNNYQRNFTKVFWPPKKLLLEGAFNICLKTFDWKHQWHCFAVRKGRGKEGKGGAFFVCFSLLAAAGCCSWWFQSNGAATQDRSLTMSTRCWVFLGCILSFIYFILSWYAWYIRNACFWIMTSVISLVQVPASLIGAIIGWKPKLKSTSLCFVCRSFGT